MFAYRTIAISDEIARAVRVHRQSPQYGHPAHLDVAQGYGPCRLCLRPFEEGAERRILFTYDPFEGLEPLPLPGPIYVHEQACVRYPEERGFPDELRFIPLTLNGYSRGRRLHAQEYVSDGNVEPLIERLLGRPDIDYIHVRNTEAGCYIMRIERTEERGLARANLYS